VADSSVKCDKFNLVTTNQRAYINFGSKFNVAAFVSEYAEVTAADSNIALHVQNSMQVQPEIKMVDVKPETLKPDIADGIYVNFQRNPHIFCIEQHNSGSNISILIGRLITGSRRTPSKIFRHHPRFVYRWLDQLYAICQQYQTFGSYSRSVA